MVNEGLKLSLMVSNVACKGIRFSKSYLGSHEDTQGLSFYKFNRWNERRIASIKGFTFRNVFPFLNTTKMNLSVVKKETISFTGMNVFQFF